MGLLDSLKNFMLQPEEDGYADYDNYEDGDEVVSSNEAKAQEEGSRSQKTYQASLSQEPIMAEETYTRRENRQAVRSSHDEKYLSDRANRAITNKPVSVIHVVEPRVYDDEIKEIAEELISGKAVIINFNKVDSKDALQIVDFISGVTYAIRGDMQKIREGIFIATPASLTIEGILKEQESLNHFFSSH